MPTISVLLGCAGGGGASCCHAHTLLRVKAATGCRQSMMSERPSYRVGVCAFGGTGASRTSSPAACTVPDWAGTGI